MARGARLRILILFSTHTGVISIHPERSSIIVKEYQQGVSFQIFICQMLPQSADVHIQIRKHAEIVSRFISNLVPICSNVLFRYDQRCVGIVSWDIAEEWPVFVFGNPLHSLIEKKYLFGIPFSKY